MSFARTFNVSAVMTNRSFLICFFFFFFQAEDGIRDKLVTGVQTCALPICARARDNYGEPLRPSRCPAPLPRYDERGGVGARARLPLGEVDCLPAPRATAIDRKSVV